MPDNIKKNLIFFSKMFFEKLNYFFSKKAKLVTLCHHLGKARVRPVGTLSGKELIIL